MSSSDESAMEVGGARGRKRGRRVASVEAGEGPDRYGTVVAGLLEYIGSSGAAGKGISRVAYEHIAGCIRQMEGIYHEARYEIGVLNGRIQEHTALWSVLSRVENRLGGSAGVAIGAGEQKVVGGKTDEGKGKAQITRPQVGRKSFAVVVRGEGEKKLEADQVKKVVLEKVKKDVPDVRVNALRRIKNGVAIEAASEKEVKILKGSPAFKEAGLLVEDAAKVGPKVLVVGVPEDLKGEALMTELHKKNLVSCTSEEEFRKRARIISLREGRLIVELPIKARDYLLSVERVYLGWNSCPVREVDLVLRCHKCYGLGHMARDCKEKESLCRNCGKIGHEWRKCKEKEECRNCKVKGKKCDHSMMSRECPLYLEAVRRGWRRITAD